MSQEQRCQVGDRVLVSGASSLVERTVLAIIPYAGTGGGFGEKWFYLLDKPLRLLGRERWVCDYTIKAIVQRAERKQD